MSLIKKTAHKYDLEQLKWELSNLNISWQPDADGSLQTALQHRGDSSFHDACGSLKDRPDISEEDFSQLLPLYEGTIISQIIEDLGAVRSRLMRKKMHTTYSLHEDKRKRYHLAIDTNEHAYFIFPRQSELYKYTYNGIDWGEFRPSEPHRVYAKELFHIPADGYVYEVDTTIPHTVANCGPDRTHLVMVKK